ncbi:MAG TPA: FkbM family methyltransferase [Pseudolabrys sp.]|jgi:FkbM family methyltransferase|nr:FkbM family methyltransferase [Pseudolabrys sp.]
MTDPYGARTPGWLDRAVIATTSHLPDSWLGLRVAIGLRRLVTMRIPDDDGLDVVRWGLRMRLHPRHNGCEKGALFTPQMYEPGERKELFAEIDRAKSKNRPFVFIDIGANVGLFSLLVASRAGEMAKIVAIEPEAENIKRLQFNIAANAGIPIQVVPLALGESAGTVVLNVGENDRGGTHVRPITAKDRADDTVTKVECRTLLEVLRQQGITSIDALKIDVEGAEDRILLPFFKDAERSLWPNLLIVEDARDAWNNDLFSELAQRGYAIETRTKLNVMMRRPVR